MGKRPSRLEAPIVGVVIAVGLSVAAIKAPTRGASAQTNALVWPYVQAQTKMSLK